MPDEYRPRPHDHIVEPVFAALRPEGQAEREAEDAAPAAARRAPAGRLLGWRIALATLCLLAIAWVVKLVLDA
jgi:hypothetical protein